MPKSTIAALQIGSSPGGTADTLRNVLSFEREIRASGAALLVLPEALLGGYPKGEIFGTRLGYRLAEGRERFAQYFAEAIDIPGEETTALAEFSTRCQTSLVIGVIERDGLSLYCTALFFNPGEGLVGKHRKLMPTGTERLIWGQGDGSTIAAIRTAAGIAGAAICWENHMPLLRMAMYAQGVQIWCAPTVDEREIWQCSMRHIAHEGRCFVVSACQVQPSPAELGVEVPGWDRDRPLIRGGSLIVGPMGDVLVGPSHGQTGLLVATIDTDDLVRAHYDFDVAGHYARPDVFSLSVDTRAKRSVGFQRD
ncbi:MAG: carbon-nitrogen hydrolase family protein [Gammaproteobacteria bacterium]|nr:carbon-nitrogen hydrolase family protein [Gammaproteobacteria bacterium]